ncbi:MAG: Rrf2 family transcriptional regulator [Clostridiales bacterium]|nr:Rrf2 family transcriptional regulator [Clostridiales bacterium]
MRVSSRGRYALRVMTDLAEQEGEKNYIALKGIAQRQEISQKYLESIMLALSKAGLVDGQHGKGGGYRLNRSPKDYSVGEILRVTEGDLAPVACLDCEAEACGRSSDCRTLPMWTELYRMINDYFDHITLASLMRQESK